MPICNIKSGDKDVTSEIAPFFGPNNDMFRSSTVITPKMLGYNELNIKTMTRENIYSENDVMY